MTKARRQRAKRGEGDQLRAEILEVADRLLLETASESAVSIQTIADGVGCTPPAIYLHFADKEALLYEVCTRHFGTFLAALEEVGEEEDDDPLETLSERGRAYIEYGLNNPEPYRILFMQRPGAAASRGVANAATESFGLLTDAIEECIDKNLIRSGDPFTISCALWASIHGLTSLMISNPDFPWPSVEDVLSLGLWSPQA